MTQIKQHTIQSGERMLLVSVPSDAVPMFTGFVGDEFEYIRMDIPFHSAVTVPTGNWQLIGLSDEITEEMSKELVDFNVGNKMYKSYGNGSMGFWFKYALESFKSLMQSLGCDGRYAILKESKNHEI